MKRVVMNVTHGKLVMINREQINKSVPMLGSRTNKSGGNKKGVSNAMSGSSVPTPSVI